MKLYFFLCFFLFINHHAFADTCPESPFHLQPKIESQVKFDNKSKLYEYSYAFKNEANSTLPLFMVTLLIDEKPTDILSPEKWSVRYENTFQDSDTFIPGNLSWDTSGKKNYLQPGKTISGFSFKSTHPPGNVKVLFDAETGIPTVTPKDGDDEPTPNCPGFLYDVPVFDSKINAITTGPAPLNQISIEMKLKKVKEEKPVKYNEDSEENLSELIPKKDNGKIAVIIKGDKDFDVNSLNISSLALGYGHATPISSNFYGEKNGEKIRIVFDSSKLGLECGRDRVLFLTGKTKSGKDIFGGAPIKTINCK